MTRSESSTSPTPRRAPQWAQRPLFRGGPLVGPLGFGAFKIGRNEGIKYQHRYDLPSEEEVAALLNGVLDLGINLIDTAPAYGVSEERIGRHLADRRCEFALVTKVGETFDAGRSIYAYDADSIRRSVERSVERLGGPPDLLLLHSDGRDLEILRETDAVATMERARDDGLVRAIGISAKSVAGTIAALPWAQTVMVEYHLDHDSALPALEAAAAQGIGTIVKKGLASGRLPASGAIRFVLGCQDVDTVVIGGLNIDHLTRNVATSVECRPVETGSGTEAP